MFTLSVGLFPTLTMSVRPEGTKFQCICCIFWLPYPIHMLLEESHSIAISCQSHNLEDLFDNIKFNYLSFFFPLLSVWGKLIWGLTFIKLGTFPSKFLKSYSFSHFPPHFRCRAIHVYVAFPMGNHLFQADLWWICFSWLKWVLFNLRLWQMGAQIWNRNWAKGWLVCFWILSLTTTIF